MNNRLVTSLLLLFVSGLLAGAPISAWSEGSNSFETTDDTRRVPIPPHDYSKDPVTVLRGGTLIDGTDKKPIDDAVVIIRGDRILAAGMAKNIEIPDTVDHQIDTSGLYILPGLIDLHIHFTTQRGEDFKRYRDSAAAAAIRGTLLASQLIDAGITSVRDVGTREDVALRIKEAVERGMIDGPRVFWSGQRIVSRAGHGDEITAAGSGSPKSLAVGARERMANGPWDWRLAVREQIRRHADWIKLTSPYTREEVSAAIDEAHMHGIPVTVDSFGKYTQWAVDAGIDSIEHPLDFDAQIIESMARNKTGFVPTLTTFYNVIETGYPELGVPAGGFYFTMARRFPVNHEEHLQVVGQAHDAGVPIGVGTDIPVRAELNYPSGYYTELGLLKNAGLSDKDVLAAATRVGAEILRMDDKLGTIKEGMLADILVVGSNPLTDIDNLRNVRLVIADGRVVRSRMHSESATFE